MYRDELEAAIARAESAESDLREAESAASAEHEEIARLKGEVERLGAEVKRLRKKAGRPDEKPERTEPERTEPEKPKAEPAKAGRGRAVLASLLGSGWLQGGVVVAALAGAVVLIIALQNRSHRRAALTGQGEVEQLVPTQLADGRRADVFLVERYGGDGHTWRLVVVDWSSWSEVVRRVVGGWNFEGIAEAAPGKIWIFLGHDRVELRDAGTLQVLATNDQILAKSPALKAAGVHDLERSPDGRLVFTAKDGQRFAVDVASLTLDPYTGATESATSHSEPRVCTYEIVGRSGVEYSTKEVDGGPRSAVTISARGRRDARFVEPSLLHPKPCMVDEDAAAILVVHAETLDSKASVLVSRLDLAGKLAWTIRLPPGSELALAERQGDQVIIGVAEPDAQLLVVDWATGTIVRRSRL